MAAPSPLQIPGPLGEDYNPLNMTAGASGFVPRSYDPIWNLQNPVGTSELPRYADPTARELAPSPNYEYGSVLPYGMNPATGELHWAMPGGAREFAQGLYDLTQGMKTGQMTPEASAALFNLLVPNMLARGEPGVVTAGGYRTMRGRGGPLPEEPTYLEAQAAARLAQTEGRSNPLAGEFVPNRALPSALAEGAQGEAAPLRVAPDQLSNPRAVYGGNQPPVPGEATTVSTSVPSAAGQPIDPHTTNGFRSGIDAMRAAPQAFDRNMRALQNTEHYPDLPIAHLDNPHDISEAAINHMRDNLVFLHDEMVKQFGQGMVDRATKWYNGANKISNDLATNYNYTPQQTAAVIANLSPQMDWFKNGELAKRAIDITRNQQDLTMTPQMEDWANEFITEKHIDATDKMAAAETDKQRNIAQRALDDVAEFRRHLAAMKTGIKLSDTNAAAIDGTNPDLRSFMVRAYDEAHNPKTYPIITPEGDFGPTAMTGKDKKTGKSKTEDIAWGSFNEINKALSALDNPDMAHISRTLGERHKVRNFYNNVSAPDSPGGHLTADTHHIAASHLGPYGASSPVVDRGLGGGNSSNATGAMGTYGVYHEAGKRAADVVNARNPNPDGAPGSRGNMLPRQMQSIVWEGIRAMITDVQKRNKDFVAQSKAIWKGFQDGLYSADEARRMMLHHAAPDGLRAPAWHNPTPQGPETR